MEQSATEVAASARRHGGRPTAAIPPRRPEIGRPMPRADSVADGELGDDRHHDQGEDDANEDEAAVLRAIAF